MDFQVWHVVFLTAASHLVVFQAATLRGEILQICLSSSQHAFGLAQKGGAYNAALAGIPSCDLVTNAVGMADE